MIDNGNISKHGVVISEIFMQRLQLKYSKLQKGIIPTAGEHQGMARLSITETFTLKLDGISNTYSVKALVCHELSDEINIGTQFLQDISKGQKTMIEFYQDGTKLTVGEESTPLIQSIVEEDPE